MSSGGHEVGSFSHPQLGQAQFSILTDADGSPVGIIETEEGACYEIRAGAGTKLDAVIEDPCSFIVESTKASPG